MRTMFTCSSAKICTRILCLALKWWKEHWTWGEKAWVSILGPPGKVLQKPQFQGTNPHYNHFTGSGMGQGVDCKDTHTHRNGNGMGLGTEGLADCQLWFLSTVSDSPPVSASFHAPLLTPAYLQQDSCLGSQLLTPFLFFN